MRTITSLTLLFSTLLLLSNCSDRVPVQELAATTDGDRIEVLDFHTDHRCKTCITIEGMTRAVLAEDYENQMEKGTITFQLINVDKEENLPMAQKFSAFGTSLVLNVINDGQEKQIDLTNFAFMNAEDEEKFKTGLKEHLTAELENM